jgi:hypothetical protein
LGNVVNVDICRIFYGVYGVAQTKGTNMISAVDALKINSNTLEHSFSQIESEIIKMRKEGRTKCYWWYNSDEAKELHNIVYELRSLGYLVDEDILSESDTLVISLPELNWNV